MYKHHIPSSTSLSGDDDDDELTKSVFFGGSDLQSAVAASARWSSKFQSLPTFIASRPGSHRPPMSHLPPEILIHILKHLHSPRDLYNTLRVSRTWCECSVELLWHRPAFPKVQTLGRMARLLLHTNQTFTYASFIRRLNFLTIKHDLKDDKFTAFAKCDRLERLTLVNCDSLTSRVLSRTLPCFPNLVAIDLTGVTNTTNEAIIGLASSASRLQGINLAGCTQVSDQGITALARNCPLLRRVKLSGVALLTDVSVSALAKSCPLLLEIDLNQCELVTDDSVRDIWVYSTHMRELRLSHCPALTDAAFPAPVQPDTCGQNDGPHPFPCCNPQDGDDMPPLIISRSLDHLRMLDLTACSQVTDEAIEGIISHASKIRNLVLSKCGHLTDRSIENICRLGRHLHYLHLGHAARITDRSVRTLARSCTRLRYIDLANCVLLTDMSVFELASLQKLRRVGLVRVSNLTDEAIYSLAERHATLERIHLSYCDQISVMAIHFLLQKLHKLTHLSLTGVPAFRQPELQQFCREPPRDFNSAQQLAFCVYSGKGVSQLRAFLTELFDHITELNGATDDTEYEDELDPDAYLDDTPEPETGNEAEDDDVHPPPIMNNVSHSETRPMLAARPVVQQPHEFVFHRERNPQSLPVPSGDRNISNVAPAVNLQGATTRLNAHIMAQTPAAIPRTRRVNGQNRTVADILPLVEASTSPPPSDVASNRSGGTNQSNGAGFFRAQQDGAPTGVSPRSNGALTPDLNFAEIGHGRGTHLSHSSRTAQENVPHPKTSHGIPAASTASQLGPSLELSNPIIVESKPLPSEQDNAAQAGPSSVVWPYREPSSPSLHGPTFPLPADHRGRGVKQSIRSTLNVAEQYATTFLFGRPGPQDDNGPNASGSGGKGR
ncbi:hypothetical protein BD779DRAFT_1465829 [Infundibulicybe gibba]|nr:hypothetical protein BD779DRAFT_1465829 [Infundibulicybe gibba]